MSTLTPAKWIAAQRVSQSDIEALLAVATLYVEAFQPNELMSLTELARFQEIEDILDRHGRRY